MKRQLKVFVVPGMNGDRFFQNKVNVRKQEDADVVVFTGGADINPAIYGREAHPTTYFSDYRDSYEIEAFNQMRPDQLALGICRGAQLLCALNGGILVQNVTGHTRGHYMVNGLGERFPITSLHHQMMYPWGIDKENYDVIFWSTGISSLYEGDGVDSSLIKKNVEPEVVYFHSPDLPKCLSIQGHPEMMSPCETTDMINDLIYDILDNSYIPRGAWKMV